MGRISISILFAIYCCSAAAQKKVPGIDKDRNFVMEVKQIDEFFERFNDAPHTLLRQYLGRKFPGAHIERVALLKSITNRECHHWDTTGLESFYRFVTDKRRPAYLDFEAGGWFASVVCRFRYKNKPVDVQLVLNIRREKNGGTSWVISGAWCPDVNLTPGTSTNVTAVSVPGANHKFLNPISHATGFIGLSKAMTDLAHTGDYLDASFYHKPASVRFLQSLVAGELQFDYVSHISYYFFQVEGWVFTVNYYRQNTNNPGWLMDRLVRATTGDKERYKEKMYENGF